MFILEILLGLKSKQGDITCAFLHADLEPSTLGFAQYSKNGTKKCLKLKKTFMDFGRALKRFGNIYQKAQNMWIGTIQI
jgi:hypothetical protein